VRAHGCGAELLVGCGGGAGDDDGGAQAAIADYRAVVLAAAPNLKQLDALLVKR